MTTEEKARHYDEAIEKFDVILNLDIVKESGTIFADDVRKILPELKESSKESEDNRIRKAIKYCLDHVFTNNTTLYDTTKEQCITWLEQKSAWKPTGAQLASLEIACDRNDRIGFDLTQLLKDLKKL